MDLPRPDVTVTDPRQPGALVAVQEPEPPRLGRRGTALLAACALVAVVALLAADVVRDRREDVEQRRLDGVVDLALDAGSVQWTADHDRRTGTGTVYGVIRLVNGGPRDVRVVDARLGRLQSGRPRALGVEQRRTLVLTQTVQCPGDGSPPPPEPEVGRLQLGVQTPAGRRSVALTVDDARLAELDEQVQKACLYPPLDESVRLRASAVRADGREVVLQVDLANEGRLPLRLLSLVPARGLVVGTIAGDATGLPIVLPTSSGRPTTRTLELRLSVICSALLGADLLSPFEELVAIVEDADRTQLTSVDVLASDPDRLMRQVAGRTCSSG